MLVPRRLIPVLASLGWLAAGSALAQGTAGTGGTMVTQGTVAVTPVNIGSVTASTIAQNYLNLEQCKANDAVVFQLNNLNTNLLDLYVGDGCASTSRTTTTSTACKYLRTVTTGGVTQKFMLSVQAQEFADCSVATEATPTLWFLEVPSEHSSADIGSNYGVYNMLLVDTQPPSAPSNLSGGEGGSVISVTWKSSDTHLQGFVVFIDSSGMAAPTDAGSTTGDQTTVTPADEDGGPHDAGLTPDSGAPRVSVSGTGGASGSSGSCGPTLLVAGASTDTLPGSVRRKKITQRTASGANVLPSDLDGARSASIAVSAVDLAGNEGPLSNVACVRVVKTTGFLESYQAAGGKAVTGCPCSAMGAVHVEQSWPIALALLALVRSRRRRALSTERSPE